MTQSHLESLVNQTKPIKQMGFTLIELMVVVVIMSIVVAIGVISMGGNEQATLRAQQGSAKALLSFVRDKSTIKQQLYLVAPDEQGLSTYVQKAGKWEIDSEVKALEWQPGVTVDWEVDNRAFAQQQNLPKEGWVFWPSGDVLVGAIVMKPKQASAKAGLLDGFSSYSFRWNGLLQFSDFDTERL